MKTFLFSLFAAALMLAACDSKSTGAADVKKDDPATSGNHAAELNDLTGADKMRDVLCQNWEYKEDLEELRRTGSEDIVYRGFSLYADGTMLKDPHGYFKTGKWKLDESVKPIRLSFVFDNGEAEEWELAYLKLRELRLVRKGDPGKTNVELAALGQNFKDPYQDPFYPANNMWRYKPPKPETDAEIHKRFKAFLHFFILYYEKEIATETDIITFEGFPSCFKWYRGGIHLKKEKELGSRWFDCFYNPEQAMKAYGFADKLLTKRYNWPKNERSWLKMNVAVLKQMEARADSLSL